MAHEGGALACQGQMGARFLRCMENMLGSSVLSRKVEKKIEKTSKNVKPGNSISGLFL